MITIYHTEGRLEVDPDARAFTPENRQSALEAFRRSGLRNVNWNVTMENLSGVVFSCTNPPGGDQRKIREMTTSTARKYRRKTYREMRENEYDYRVYSAVPYIFSGRYRDDDENINDAVQQIATNVNRQNINNYAKYTFGCCMGYCKNRRNVDTINVFCLVE